MVWASVGAWAWALAGGMRVGAGVVGRGLGRWHRRGTGSALIDGTSANNWRGRSDCWPLAARMGAEDGHFAITTGELEVTCLDEGMGIFFRNGLGRHGSGLSSATEATEESSCEVTPGWGEQLAVAPG